MTGRFASMAAGLLAIMLACAGCRAVSDVAEAEQPRGGAPLMGEALAFLSFQVSEKVEPEPAVIAQIERHTVAIASQEPRVQGVDIRTPFKGKELVLEVAESTAESMSARKYDAWSHLHSQLLVRGVRVDGQAVMIDYGKTYNIPRLAREYEALPGVLSASPTWIVGDGSWIYIQRQGVEWQYVVDIASGDCIAGCAEHQLFFFLVDATGTVLRKDQWFIPNDNRPPAWVEAWREQRRTR